MSGDGWLRLFGESSDHHVRRPLSPALLQAGYVSAWLEGSWRAASAWRNLRGERLRLLLCGLAWCEARAVDDDTALIAGAHHATDFNIDTKSGLVKQEVSEEEGSTCRAS